MKYALVALAAFLSMAAALPVGEMDRTLGDMNGTAMETENFPFLDSLRRERLPIANQLRDESRTDNIMEIPIVTVDQSKIHQRDEQLIGNHKLPVFLMGEANFRQPNEHYERE